MRNLLVFLFGIITGLWLTERQHSKAMISLYERLLSVQKGTADSSAAASRVDRTPEELSDEYKNRRSSIGEYSEDEIADHLDRLTTQLVQPNMTPLEAHRVSTILSDIARSATNYDVYRERFKKKARDSRADQWINDLEDED
jgi:hypothetical protein